MRVALLGVLHVRIKCFPQSSGSAAKASYVLYGVLERHAFNMRQHRAHCVASIVAQDDDREAEARAQRASRGRSAGMLALSESPSRWAMTSW